jgi:hypothetical protein
MAAQLIGCSEKRPRKNPAGGEDVRAKKERPAVVAGLSGESTQLTVS